MAWLVGCSGFDVDACADKCTVGFWRATATQLEAEKPISTWEKRPRVVVGAKRGTSYFLERSPSWQARLQ